MKNWCIRRKYTIAVLILLFCYFEYSINKVYGFVLFPDEFGYWSYAAKASGYDWSHIVSENSYYSYGYSLILFPIFRLIKDAVITYRVAVAANFVLLAAGFLLLNAIAGKIVPDLTESVRSLMAGVAIMYPTWLFYAKITLAEVLLMTMYLLVAVLLYHYLENNKLSTLVLLMFALVYLYIVHMRTVATVIAAGIVLFIHMLQEKHRRKQIISGFICLFVLLLLACLVKKWIGNTIYAETDMNTFYTNDYGGQISKFKYMLTFAGMKDFIVSLIGKVLYLGLATYGLFYLGILSLIQNIYKAFKEKTCTKDAIFELFVLLATVGQILITTIFTIHGGRADGVTYGRYNEFLLPIIMLLGCYDVWNRRRIWPAVAVVITVHLPMVWIVIRHISVKQLTSFHPYFILGIAYLKKNGVSINTFYFRAYIINTVLMILVMGCIRLIKRIGNINQMWFLLLTMELMLGMHLTRNYMDSTQEAIFYDQQLSYRIEALLQERKRDLKYMCLAEEMAVSSMQFQLREQQIIIIKKDKNTNEYPYDTLDEDDLILMDHDNPCQEQLSERYEYSVISGHFMLMYNE